MRLTLLACICAYLLNLSYLPAQIGEPKSPTVSLEVIFDIVKSIPSPLELSFLIKGLEIAYDKSLLTPAINTTTEFRQALHLGMYNTDLGYTTIYGQTHDALAYLKNIKNITDKLDISEIIDFKTLQKFTSTRGNLDTLLLVADANLNDIHTHFIEKNRADLTILILTGSWIESLRLACEAHQKQPNEWLKNRIGEQKIVLEQLQLLLSFYEFAHTDYQNLMKELNMLSRIYKEVKITYTEKETTTKEGNNGEIIAEGTSESTITVSKETLKAIHQLINRIYQFINQDAINPNTKIYIYKEKKKKINTKYLYGTWEMVEVNDKPATSKILSTFTFLKDKTFIQTAGKRKRKGTWDIATNKNQILLAANDIKSDTINVIALNHNILIVQGNNDKITFKKVKP